MAKKEKEYINFLKSKLEPNVNSVNIQSNLTNNYNLNSVSGQIMPNNSSNTKDPKASVPTGIPGAVSPASIQNQNFAENTKSEFNFNTLVNISHMCGQNQISQKINLIAIGMVDGSVLIWDTELHCDRYLFQDNKNEILSMTMNSNFLTTAAKDGQIYIFDLVKGCRVFHCYHNPYKNFPVFYVRKYFTEMINYV
jgi:WD40 repeat protein